MIWLFFGCKNTEPPALDCHENIQVQTRRLTTDEIVNSIVQLTNVEPPRSLLPQSNLQASPRNWVINTTLSYNDLENLLLAGKFVTENIDWNQQLPCLYAELSENCIAQYLSETAEIAFRKKLTEQEEAIILAPIESGISLEQALDIGLQIILQSPQFIYLNNSSPTQRLSYLFRKHPASSDLLQKESADEVVRNLLSDPLFIDTFIDFHYDWLNLYQLNHLTKDDDRYDNAFIESSKRETNLFLSNLLWNEEATFPQLLLNTRGWINPAIQASYNVNTTEDWTVMELGENRPGILSRGSFLTAHSYSAQTAPVRRGYFILKELLCIELTPPSDVNMTLESVELGDSVQDQLAAHSSDPSCSGCHDQIDPLGIAFEHFDHLGSWRDRWDNGETIPQGGVVLNQQFSSLNEMLNIVAHSKEAQACYSKHWLEYALARPLTEADQCVMEEIQEQFVASGGNLRQLLYSIATSAAFWKENNEN